MLQQHAARARPSSRHIAHSAASTGPTTPTPAHRHRTAPTPPRPNRSYRRTARVRAARHSRQCLAARRRTISGMSRTGAERRGGAAKPRRRPLMEPRPRRRPDAALVSPPPPPPSPSSSYAASTMCSRLAHSPYCVVGVGCAMRHGLARRSRRGSRARPAVPAASLALLYPHLVAQRVIPRLEQHRRRDHLLPAQRSEPPRRLARTPARQLLEPRPRQLLESQPHQQSRLAELWRNGRAPAPSCRAVMEESHEQECRWHSSAHVPPPPSHIAHAHLIAYGE